MYLRPLQTSLTRLCFRTGQALRPEENKAMKSFEGSFRNLNFSPFTSILLNFFFPFIVKYKTSVLSNNRFSKEAQAFKETSFSKATMIMRFSSKKNAGCPKAPRDFPPRKDGILYPPSGCLGTPLPLPQSLCGRTEGRTVT